MNFKYLMMLGLMICGLSSSMAQNGSIWGGRTLNYQSVYADTLASQVGDLITINVSLSTQASKKQATNTAKENTLEDSIDHLFFNTPAGPAGATGTTEPKDGTFDFWRYRNLPPSIKLGGTRSHKGGGDISNQEGLTTTVQARIVDVLPNNTLRIQAKRYFNTGDEKTTIIITGLVRREDLASDNSVSSNKVSDLKIEQEGVGTLSRDQKKGFITRMFETLNPF